ncbi:glycosyltransferase family 2 protein [Novosphingobium percolationis]|nr:glycosyltransferase [Novosphingobium percolationis]
MPMQSEAGPIEAGWCGGATLPFISIIIPTYQRRDVVCDALRAIDRIAYGGPFETIVVVDGSTDGTEAAIAGLALRHPPRVLVHANKGPAYTRNRGAGAAQGEILLFLDDDMMCREDILDAHVAAHRTGADAVMGDIPLDPTSPRGFLSAGVGAWAEQRRLRLASGGALDTADLLGGHISVRREVFTAIGGFDGRFTRDGTYGNEDLDFGVRLLERHTVVFCAQAVAFQRYVVTPAQNLRQYFEAGEADVLFARKHPGLAADVFAPHRPDRLRVRWLIRPLARIPGAPWVLARLACLAAARQRTSPRMDRFVERVFSQTREVLYWAGVNRARKMLH